MALKFQRVVDRVKLDKLFLVILLFIMVFFTITPVCHGNSAEPPSILIIVPNAPRDLEIGIGSGGTYTIARRIDKAMESYFTFYLSDLNNVNDYTLKISTGDDTFEIELDKPIRSYNNIYSLNIRRQTLTPGKSLSRSILLVSLRITLTLIIEAIVFWLFGYRQKISWLAFLIINLLSQGTLNIMLNGESPIASYVIFGLIIGEIFVLIFESIAFLRFVREHSRWRRFLYVLTANLLSLIAGGYAITILPI